MTNDDDKNVDDRLAEKATKLIITALEQLKTSNGTPEERLDVVEAIIASLVKDIRELGKSTGALSQSMALLLEAIGNLGGRVKNLEKMVGGVSVPQAPLSPKDAN